MRPNVASLNEIRGALEGIDSGDLISAMEEGFVAYSENRAVVPPVGHLGFNEPPGDVHLKYGYIQGGGTYVVKEASSFYDNPKRGLASSNGLMLVFNQQTGGLQNVLLDEGYLTDVRTAVAGAVVAKYLAPTALEAVGIVGTGTQARLQLQYLRSVLDFSDVYVWGRSEASLQKYAADMQKLGFSNVVPTKSMADITAHCNYIVTATPATQPLIMAERVRAGTHITAMGADSPGKQELDPSIFARAAMVVVDSRSQCIDHGEAGHAVRAGLIGPEKLLELGSLIKGDIHRGNDDQITVADLTGVAVQDIKIAELVSRALAS